MQPRPRTLITLILLGFIAGMFPESSVADPACPHWVAKLVSLQGQVDVKSANSTQWRPAGAEETFCPGDRLHVGEQSRAAVVLSSEAVFRVDQNTTLLFPEAENKKLFILELIEGAAHFFSRKPRSLEVVTPFVNGVVEGTEFYVQVDQEQSIFSVFRGSVRTINQRGELLLTDGQAAFAQKDHAPELRITARPRDAVTWALYYPSVGTSESEGFQAELLSAERLLRVGRADQARSITDGILAIDSKHSTALALNAVIALVQDRKEDARDVAEQAVQSNPRSTPARMAMSYVQQAHFDVEGARDTLRYVTDDDSGNALVWARLSELWLATGYPHKALSAARKALRLSPQTSRTQTVLGFAHIAAVEISAAKTAFQNAIDLDQGDPLPRLGLGLALIRGGDLKEGRAQIEIAAALDPGNALIRSYLGKAFYEEKDDRHARRQYQVAKELDPNDPTPYLYDAIHKHSENRPVEALHDLQTSVTLNDNRAVYRSQLLLDEDLAARSAGLGGIYNTLGFQQQGLIQGYRSVDLDPGNYSAHKFLSDTYADIPRFEMAKASESLQSQLLQPLNTAPIDPLMGEGDTFFFKNNEAATVSYNAYDSLFLRNRLGLQLSGFGGSQSTFGNQVIQSGVSGRFSYSLSNYHLASDGFRENNDVENDLFTAYVQGLLTPKTSLQAEYRYRTREHGDLTLRFDDDFSSGFREEQSSILGRLGFSHRFSPNSILVGSLIRESVDIDQNDDDYPGLDYQTAERTREGWLAELQHILKGRAFNLTYGIGRMDQTIQTLIVNTIPETVAVIEMPPFPPFEFVIPAMDLTVRDDADFKNDAIYAYSRIQLHKRLLLTAGLSADSLSYGDQLKEDQLNPKLGATWQIGEGTTLRAAAFRGRSKTFAFAQTIEPTQVAGFNQFYDDPLLSDVRQYGAGADHQFGPDLSAGIAYTQRYLDVPVFGENSVSYSDWDENTTRAYLYWSPWSFLALSSEYINEWFDIDPVVSGEITNIRTQRLPLTARFFHPCGFSAMIKGTYVDQSGEYFSRSSLSEGTVQPTAACERFWVFDLQIDYRLAKRAGVISLGVKNLFDETFALQEIDPRITGASYHSLSPERFIYAGLTLDF